MGSLGKVCEEFEAKDNEGEKVEVEVKGAEFEASEAEVDSTEILGIDDTKELGIPFNWSSGVVWKVAAPGLSQFLIVSGVE